MGLILWGLGGCLQSSFLDRLSPEVGFACVESSRVRPRAGYLEVLHIHTCQMRKRSSELGAVRLRSHSPLRRGVAQSWSSRRACWHDTGEQSDSDTWRCPGWEAGECPRQGHRGEKGWGSQLNPNLAGPPVPGKAGGSSAEGRSGRPEKEAGGQLGAVAAVRGGT